MRIEMKKPSGLKLKTAGKFCDEDIIVEPVLQVKEITVTENTTVKSDAGYVGFSKVIVNVKAPECDHPECKHIVLTCDLDFAGSQDGEIVGEMVFAASPFAAYEKIYINRPDALIPENIKEGVQIAGVKGTMKTQIDSMIKYSYAEGVGF